MHLAGLALPNYQVALYALRGVSEASGRPERGFVGHDVLRRFTVEIDYREQRVRLYDPARYHYAGSGTVVPFAAGDDRPLLHGSITVPGRPPIPARLLLDTGASGLCLILTVPFVERHGLAGADRKSTRLNSSHLVISYAVFCLKKKKNTRPRCASGARSTRIPSDPRDGLTGWTPRVLKSKRRSANIRPATGQTLTRNVGPDMYATPH